MVTVRTLFTCITVLHDLNLNVFFLHKSSRMGGTFVAFAALLLPPELCMDRLSVFE